MADGAGKSGWVVSLPKERQRRRRARLGGTLRLLVTLAVMVALGGGVIYLYLDRPEQAGAPGAAVRVHFPICGAGRRHTCVVDGDTLWLDGEKMRLRDINAPEVSEPDCRREAELGRRATVRLQTILNGDSFTVSRHGRDRYGRTLVVLDMQGGSAGDRLVREGLAHRWQGEKRDWC